jgi:hypothetical protein
LYRYSEEFNIIPISREMQLEYGGAVRVDSP